MILSILIANRGEIACRIMRTCRRLGIRTIAVFSDADVNARHVSEADEAVHIGPAPAAESYLQIGHIIAAAQRTGADAIHPGFGFLAENAAFARACAAAGLIFIGPTPEAIEAMGNKRTAKGLVAQHGVPILPGYDRDDQSDAALTTAAADIGFPIMVKATAGGGGKGMRLVHSPADLPAALSAARREGVNSFGSDELTLEKALLAPRHIEVQVFGDAQGHIIHLGERDCSIQRRHQKVIEEAPAPGITAAQRAEVGAAAVAAAQAVNYVGAGTVEFLYQDESFYFLEMNTRLQVEHPVTEMITGQDLVEWQILVAEGAPLPLTQNEITWQGHAIEARVYAEDPAHDFRPVVGSIAFWQAPPEKDGVRVDAGLHEQDEISIYYDPMIAKIIAWGPTRLAAIRRISWALRKMRLIGLVTNAPFLIDILQHPAFQQEALSTHFISDYLSPWTTAVPHESDPGVLIAATIRRYLADVSDYVEAAGPWRNIVNRPLLYLFQEAPTVSLTVGKGNYAVSFGEQEYQVSVNAVDGHQLTLSIDGHRRTFTCVSVDDNWWITSDHGTAVFSTGTLLPRPIRYTGKAGSLTAPMPGLVLDVLVQPGETVEVGQPLLKLEAMKMEHTINSPADGIVTEIYFAAGDQVAADVELLMIGELDS